MQDLFSQLTVFHSDFGGAGNKVNEYAHHLNSGLLVDVFIPSFFHPACYAPLQAEYWP